MLYPEKKYKREFAFGVLVKGREKESFALAALTEEERNAWLRALLLAGAVAEGFAEDDLVTDSGSGEKDGSGFSFRDSGFFVSARTNTRTGHNRRKRLDTTIDDDGTFNSGGKQKKGIRSDSDGEDTYKDSEKERTRKNKKRKNKKKKLEKDEERKRKSAIFQEKIEAKGKRRERMKKKKNRAIAKTSHDNGYKKRRRKQVEQDGDSGSNMSDKDDSNNDDNVSIESLKRKTKQGGEGKKEKDGRRRASEKRQSKRKGRGKGGKHGKRKRKATTTGIENLDSTSNTENNLRSANNMHLDQYQKRVRNANINASTTTMKIHSNAEDGVEGTSEERFHAHSFKEGYLTKEGGFITNWKRRFFVLTRHNLAYYRVKQPGEQARWNIPLLNASLSYDTDNPNHKYSFIIQVCFIISTVCYICACIGRIHDVS